MDREHFVAVTRRPVFDAAHVAGPADQRVMQQIALLAPRLDKIRHAKKRVAALHSHRRDAGFPVEEGRPCEDFGVALPPRQPWRDNGITVEVPQGRVQRVRRANLRLDGAGGRNRDQVLDDRDQFAASRQRRLHVDAVDLKSASALLEPEVGDARALHTSFRDDDHRSHGQVTVSARSQEGAEDLERAGV